MTRKGKRRDPRKNHHSLTRKKIKSKQPNDTSFINDYLTLV
jgi:hypothetical protein